MNQISKISNGLNSWSLYLMKLDWYIFFKIRLDTSTRIWLTNFKGSVYTKMAQFYSGFKNDFCLENYLLRFSEYNRN